MRAVVLRDRQMVLRDDVPEPIPGPGQVLVGVRACGICGSDLHFAKHGETMLELGQQMQGSSNGDQKTGGVRGITACHLRRRHRRRPADHR
jgi:threonine dehydrogenase-like Zn-dependent dehydrogenase